MIKALVLHIDDDGFYRHMFQRLAANVFEEVRSVDSLEAARDLSVTWEPSLCFLDLNLTGTQGQATLEAFQSMFPDLPVIVLTGVEQAELPEGTTVLKKGDRPGVREYLEAAKAALLQGVTKLDQLGEWSGILTKAVDDWKEAHA